MSGTNSRNYIWEKKKHKMNKKIKFLIIGLACTIASSCGNESGNEKPPSNSINKIMPLGASRVEGARPEFESFRYELWKDLLENEWTFDFIGSQTDEASYPSFMGNDFDVDHEGRGGWTSEEILEGINEWLNAVGTPDIVLFSSPGGNDILNGLASYDETVSNINEIIDVLQDRNPNVTIIIEELAPGKSSFMTQQLTADFDAIQEEVKIIADRQSTSTSQVISVDMYSGFTDSLLADDVHYNQAGAEFIADRYYMVLVDVLE